MMLKLKKRSKLLYLASYDFYIVTSRICGNIIRKSLKYCGIAIDGEERGNTNVVLANLREQELKIYCSIKLKIIASFLSSSLCPAPLCKSAVKIPLLPILLNG
jgi:hypothetical protein